MKYYCRDKENCMNKDICLDCLIKIDNDLPYLFKNKKDFMEFVKEKECKIKEKYSNQSGAKFISFIFKEFNFVFYECQKCFKWYRVYDHPFRLMKYIEENQFLSPTCSKKCGYKHRDNSIYKTNGYNKKLCNVCEKETLHNASICCECNKNAKTHNSTDYKKIAKNNMKSGVCTSCGEFNEKRSVAGLGKDNCNCSILNIRLINKIKKKHKHLCPKCGFTEITGGVNWKCKECEYLYMSGGFDREKFYKQIINIAKLDYLNEEVNVGDFDALKNKLGVWSRWTDLNNGNYCLDVCKTIDIGGEMLSSIRSFYSLKENQEQILDYTWKEKYKRQLNDCGNGKIIFKLVCLCSDEKEALRIESQYAYENKAKYWSPEPGQSIFKNM